MSSQQQEAVQGSRHVGRTIQSQSGMEVSKLGEGGEISKEVMQASQVSEVRPELGTCGENKRRDTKWVEFDLDISPRALGRAGMIIPIL